MKIDMHGKRHAQAASQIESDIAKSEACVMYLCATHTRHRGVAVTSRPSACCAELTRADFPVPLLPMIHVKSKRGPKIWDSR